jgi:hypothetical protein
VSPHSSSISGARSAVSSNFDVGLRGAACLWQAVPKRFTQTDIDGFGASGAMAERRRHDGMSGISSRREQSADARRGRHSSWATSWRFE